MGTKYLLFYLPPGGTFRTTSIIEDSELEDNISEQDANRFRAYAVPGDFYEFGDVLVVRLGRAFSADDSDSRH